jgi:hypothetical protein
MALFEEAALSALLFNAFKALGPGPQRREIATVAKALRESGDEEVQALLGDRENWDWCCEIADAAGAYGFVALDLVMAFTNPVGFAKLIPPRRGRRGTVPSRARLRDLVAGGGHAIGYGSEFDERCRDCRERGRRARRRRELHGARLWGTQWIVGASFAQPLMGIHMLSTPAVPKPGIYTHERGT